MEMMMRTFTRSTATPLSYPFGSRISEHAEVVQANTLSWLEAMGIDMQGQLLAGISEVGFLVARAYPDGDLEGLQLASDWTTLFFLLDDLVEQIEDPHEVGQNNMLIMGALEGVLFGSQDPVHKALRDVGLRLNTLAGRAGVAPEWLGIFNDRVSKWLGSHIWEAENRASGSIPSPEAYIYMRQLTIGMHFEFALSELLGGYSLNQDTRSHAAIQQLERMALNLIAWSNDILTVEKELAANEVHNLILCIKNTRPMAMSAARTIAINMHNVEMADFIRVRDSLAYSSIWSFQVAQYVADLQHWIAGHLQWGVDSKRYNVAQLSLPPLPSDLVPTVRP